MAGGVWKLQKAQTAATVLRLACVSGTLINLVWGSSIHPCAAFPGYPHWGPKHNLKTKGSLPSRCYERGNAVTLPIQMKKPIHWMRKSPQRLCQLELGIKPRFPDLAATSVLPTCLLCFSATACTSLLLAMTTGFPGDPVASNWKTVHNCHRYCLHVECWWPLQGHLERHLMKCLGPQQRRYKEIRAVSAH